MSCEVRIPFLALVFLTPLTSHLAVINNTEVAKQPLLTGEQNGCYAWTKNQHNIIIPLSPSSCLSLDHNRTHPRTAETETLRCLCKPLSGEEEPDLGAEKIKDHLQPYTKLIWVRQDQGK